MAMLPEPLRIGAFRAFWVARLAATIAQMAMVIVIGWQVYDIARETMDVKAAALRLGLIGVVQFVPLFALSLVAGWTADHVDRRYVGRAAVARWTEILPRREYVVDFQGFERVGRGVLIPCELRFHDGAAVQVFVGWVFDDGLVRDGRTFASEAAAREWLESG